MSRAKYDRKIAEQRAENPPTSPEPTSPEPTGREQTYSESDIERGKEIAAEQARSRAEDDGFDPTEQVRRELVAEINAKPAERVALEEKHGVGNVWDTDELTRDFEVIGFMAPFCSVRRKVDGKKGCVEFQHMPRYYYGFIAD